MNRYTPDNQFILDNAGNKYAVNVAHPLPLPNGIEACSELVANNSAFGAGAPVVFGGPGAEWGLNGGPIKSDTHWLARAPLPPVPKPKTQAELDAEGFEIWRLTNTTSNYDSSPEKHLFRSAFFGGLAYARKEAK